MHNAVQIALYASSFRSTRHNDRTRHATPYKRPDQTPDKNVKHWSGTEILRAPHPNTRRNRLFFLGAGVCDLDDVRLARLPWCPFFRQQTTAGLFSVSIAIFLKLKNINIRQISKSNPTSIMVDAGATSPGAREKQLDAQIKSADMVSPRHTLRLRSQELSLMSTDG